MRRIAKNSLVAALAFAAVIGLYRPSTATAADLPHGVTVSPATATLSLAKGDSAQTASFSVSNGYAAPITLRFSFAQAVTTPGGAASATKQLSISPSEVTIAPGQTAKPVITLTDNDKLAPGSQQVELVMSQVAAPSTTVSIVPSVRMQLIIIKQDGAVTNLGVSAIHKPAFALDLPQEVSFKVANNGNVIAIPRGYVSIQDPRGREISKGILNTASAAVTPGSQLRVNTAMTKLNQSLLPGMYRVQIAYGLGGGQPAKTVSTQFFYLPVWQILLVGLLGAMAYCGRQIWVEWTKMQRHRNAQPQQPLAAGRGIA